MISASLWEENPYIIGSVIYEPKRLIDREEIFDFIKDNLSQNAKVILLHGQRRIGKSSVLTQIPNFVDLDNFVFIPLSLEGKSQKRLSEVLHDFARDILDNLDVSFHDVKVPTKNTLQETPQAFANEFLTQIYEKLNDKNLVLLIDEFDVLGDYSQDTAITHFFPYLKFIVDKHRKLYVIPVVGRRLDDMPNLLSLFRQAPNHEIGLLDRKSAEELIIKPAQGVLEYDPEAINAILELSAGHPYFTQVICFALFSHARDEQRWRVTRQDVEKIIDEAIEFGEGGLAWFRDGLPIPERLVFSAVAEAQQAKPATNGTYAATVQDIEAWDLLQQYGVLMTEAFYTAQERLIQANYLEITELSKLPVSPYYYRVTVELVRRWLVKRYSFRRELWQLEKISPEAQRIYEIANIHRRHGDIVNALNFYEQALGLNPNHFSALFELAEGYLDIENYAEAVEHYTRGYQIDPFRTEDKLVQALLGYARQLKAQGKYEFAKERYSQALALQPDNTLIQAALNGLEREEWLSDAIAKSISGQTLLVNDQGININQGITLDNIGVGEVSGMVANSIEQLEDTQEPDNAQLATLLKELQAAIEADADLAPEDKAEVMAQMIALAKAGKNPEKVELHRMAKRALWILRGTLAGLPNSAQLVQQIAELLDVKG